MRHCRMAETETEAFMSTEEIDAEPPEATTDKINLILVVLIPTICIISRFSVYLSVQLAKMYFKCTPKEKELLETMKDLKKQMASIPMVQEFAKYSKVQRKLNMVTLDYETTVGSRQTMRAKLETIIKYGLQSLVGLILVITIYKSRNVPVFIIPELWFYPLSALLAYPTGISGAVSVMAWLFLVRSMMNLLSLYKQKTS